MASGIIPPTAPFQVPVGSVISTGINLYTFSSLDAGVYHSVHKRDVAPVGALLRAYLTAYGLPASIPELPH